jgi:hypothetical protein
MADVKITALAPIGANPVNPATFPIPMVDLLDNSMAASGTTKKVTVNQILGAGGTATLASATITGDLTVDTNTLFVDSANNYVGIGTASPSTFLDVYNASSARIAISGPSTATSYLIFRNTTTGTNKGYIGYEFANDAIPFALNGSEAMRLNSTGLGVGVSPAAKLDVFGNAALTGTSGFKYLYFNLATDTNSIRGAKIGKNYDSPFDLNIHATTSASGLSNEAAIKFYRNLTDVSMTLDASGNLLVGTTDTGSNSGIGIKSVYSSTAPYVSTVGSSNASNVYSYLLYSTTDAAFKFYVSYSGTVSATNGTISAISDARLKENVQDIDVGLSAILALKPRKFDWKAGKGKDIKGDRGFIAQEFEQVFPNLIDEWKDPAPEGEAPYKSVRQDLIPVLVKAIQELAAEVNALKNA